MITNGMETRLTRRAAVVLALALAAASVTACGADKTNQPASHGLTHIKFALKTPLRGILAPMAVARDKGYFRAEGLDVEFVEPASNTDSAKLVASGNAQLGNVDAMPMLFARDQGIPLVSVSTTLQHGQLGIVAPAKMHLTSPAQLKGHTVGVSGLPGQTDMFKTVLKESGVKESDVKIVEVGFNGAAAMAAGKIDAIGDGSLWTQRASYNVAMKKPLNDMSTVTFLDFEKLNAPRVYLNNIVTTEKYLHANPEIVKHFLRAFVRATDWSLAHPKEAFNVLMAANSELEPDFNREQFAETAALTTSTETEQHGLGWQDPTVWQNLAKYFHDAGLIKAKVDVNQVMSNDYLPGKNAE